MSMAATHLFNATGLLECLKMSLLLVAKLLSISINVMLWRSVGR